MTQRTIDIQHRKPIGARPGPAPMLQWVRVDQLVIDDTYQRPLGRANWAAIDRIAANFVWSRFQPLLVAPVEGGRFAVIDGQHRAHAAMLCGIAEVPAMAVMVGREEQSRAFAWVNSQTIRVTPLQVFKSALVAGEDWAVRAHAAATWAGCTLMTFNRSGADKQAGEVYCIGVIKKLIQAGMDDAVKAGLKALRLSPAMDRHAAYTDFVLKDWIPAVHDSLVRDPAVLAEALAIRNPFKVIEDARASLLAGTPSDKARKALAALISEAAARRIRTA